MEGMQISSWHKQQLHRVLSIRDMLGQSVSSPDIRLNAAAIVLASTSKVVLVGGGT